MAKDPAFLFYPGDWLGGTMGMTLEEKGAYIEMLIFQFNNGKFSEEQATQIIGAKNWPKIRQKFSKKNQFFFNERLKEEIEKRRKHCEYQTERIKKRWKNRNNPGNTPVLPLENENENTVFSVFKKESTIHEDTTGLSELDKQKTIEFCWITLKRNYSQEAIYDLWKAFLINNQDQFYPKKAERVRHFRNWIKTQPFDEKPKKVVGLDADEFIKQKLKQ